MYTLRIRPKFASNHGNEVEHSQVKKILVTNILTSQMLKLCYDNKCLNSLFWPYSKSHCVSMLQERPKLSCLTVAACILIETDPVQQQCVLSLYR